MPQKSVCRNGAAVLLQHNLTNGHNKRVRNMSEIRSYIVFGATGGIGSAVCRSLQRTGARVLAAGRNTDALEQLSTELDIATRAVDATNTSEVDACFKHALELFGTLGGVVNCVGSLLLKPAHLTTEEEWQDTLDLNLGSAFNTVRSATKAMFKTGGSIVLISSAAARTGLVNHEAIAAAKAGVLGLMRSAAATYAKNSIRLNAVAPGLVKTPMTERLTANPAVEQASINMHALGRLGNAEDIANTIVWLLQPEQSWITGQVFGVDGGLATLRPRTKA
jgi:NAD(P)-dependent dehydrogenase (short-subunit alcohol dehydrogenase family)